MHQDLYCRECLALNGISEFDSIDKIASLYNEINEYDKNNILIENLCFSGGGVKTFSYIGGLEILQEYGLLNNIKRIASASAGSIIALLVAFKYNTNEMKEMLYKPHNDFLDRSSWSFSNMISIFKGNYGLHSGNIISLRMKELVNAGFDKSFPDFRKEKAKEKNTDTYDPTFNDLYEKFGVEIVFSATNLTRERVEYLCPRNHPDMPLYIGARISMSYPLIYEYVTYNNCAYTDSICSFPICLFSDNSDTNLLSSEPNMFDKTLGFYNHFPINENSENPSKNGFISYIYSIIQASQTYIESADIRVINKSHDFDDHTISAFIKHLKLFDLDCQIDKLQDCATLYKIKTLLWMKKKLQK